MRILTMAMLGAVLVTTGSAKISGGQIPAPSHPWMDQMNRMSQPDAMRMATQKRMLMNDRQKHLVADTEKLVELTTALKQQVDESNKDILSVDMIRKAEEIEKLARSVKERIKG